jgi:rhodanese-related sulfurtransferase
MIAAALLLLAAPALQAEERKEVRIAPDLPEVQIETPDGVVALRRDPDTEAELTGDFARTSRPCPPFCIQPMTPAEGVTTVGELELIELLQDPETTVIDSRTWEWFSDGTIPGAVHMPWTGINERLDELGCEIGFDGWECEDARKVALFCNGPWCGQSPTAIRAMIQAGYPAERISYYRGGMQLWRLLGLTVVRPGS